MCSGWIVLTHTVVTSAICHGVPCISRQSFLPIGMRKVPPAPRPSPLSFGDATALGWEIPTKYGRHCTGEGGKPPLGVGTTALGREVPTRCGPVTGTDGFTDEIGRCTCVGLECTSQGSSGASSQGTGICVSMNREGEDPTPVGYIQKWMWGTPMTYWPS